MAAMAKLPWFKFYAQDWLTDPRVLSLTNEQRGIYHWLLCRQWHDGDLPGDVMHIYPLLPPGSDSASVAYVLSTFFPPDPDTTRRSNPKLAEQQDERASAYASRVEAASNARKGKARKSLQANGVSSHQSSDQGKKVEPEVEVETEKADRQGEPVFALKLKQAVVEALRTNASLCNQGAEFQAYLKPMHGLDQKLADWTADGIPEELILAACVETCQRFVSTPENPRIGSWRYFDASVRKAFKQSRALSESQQADQVMAEVIAQMQKAHEQGVL